MDSTFRKLDRILRQQASDEVARQMGDPYLYARCMAEVENVVAVVSDLSRPSCRIFAGAFAKRLGLDSNSEENSIWEREILSRMEPEERNEKFLAELRFLHFLRGLPRVRRGRYYLASRLRFSCGDGSRIDVLHRLYYLHNPGSDSIRYALCLYGPLAFDFPWRSVAVDSTEGTVEELTPAVDGEMLSRREKQVLSLIKDGKTSREIASALNISPHTVSRHRQSILSRLQVRNSVEACRLASSLSII